MKTEELRQLSEEELNAKMRDAKEELFNLRFQTATGQLDNTSRIKEVKKDIARVFTILRERELESERV
jgi:large subunit ribosomal protein L29